jgi:hypothetical protein
MFRLHYGYAVGWPTLRSPPDDRGQAMTNQMGLNNPENQKLEKNFKASL